jgi:callose synthase
MLRSRFEAIPLTFCTALLPPQKNRLTINQSDESASKEEFAKFSLVWNEFIESMWNEDLIKDFERDMLRLPDSSSKSTVIQWPPFLLASKIPIAVDMAQNVQGKRDKDLFKEINGDDQMKRVVIECYETLKDVLDHLIQGDCEKSIIKEICHEVEFSIKQLTFLRQFRTSYLNTISKKLGELLGYLEDSWKEHKSTSGGLEQKNAKDNEHDIIEALQDLVEIITKDFTKNGRQIREKAYNAYHVDHQKDRRQRFANINLDFTRKKKWRAKIVRLKLLVTEKESAINVPVNLEARRRITFFTTSLYMKMPPAPKVRDMLSFSERNDVLQGCS